MICRMVVVAVLLLVARSTWAAELVYTEQTRFRIPYESNPQELARLGAHLVQLHVSVDHGATWQFSQSVSPRAGQFEFQAPADGEYWFAVRTVDGAGRLYPPNSSGLTAGLKVMVDSQKPSLKLSLKRDGDRMRLTWRAADAALALDSLNLKVRQGSESEWSTLRIAQQAEGQTNWPTPENGIVAVRGVVEDKAGNRGTAKAELTIGKTDYAPLPARPDLEGPIANVEAPKPDLPAHPQSTGVPGQLVSRQTKTPALAKREPVEAPIALAKASSSSDAARERRSVSSDAAGERRSVSSETAGEQPSIEKPSPPASKPVEQKTADPSRNVASKGQSDETGAQLVGNRTFQLGYAIEEVGPSGVGEVEFFITEDTGRKWYRYGSDTDHKSPYTITVPREGSYGFLVRVQSGVGLGKSPPRPGQEPAFRVVVDETPPKVTLSPPTQHAGSSGPTVRLNWQASDPHPANRGAVDIAYATSPKGPWKPIASGLEDTGQYEWRTTDSSGPRPSGGRLYFRVTARDAAGNIGAGITAEPVVVDFVRPKARITDVVVRVPERKGPR